MTETIENPNLKRRRGPGLLVALTTPFIKPFIRIVQRKSKPGKTPVTVFQSYMIGDLFMALPALKILAAKTPLQVLCRPDCLDILQSEGLAGVPFDNAFLTSPGPISFLRTFRRAWKLRGSLGKFAVDFDADPRSAFWLKIAGAECAVSYNRSSVSFFDVLLPMPPDAAHQNDRDRIVASKFLDRFSDQLLNAADVETSRAKSPGSLDSGAPSSAAAPSGFWIVSCWTRKDTKNWPLDRWDEFLNKMIASGIRFQILDAPDGDSSFREFKARWSGKTEMLQGSLPEIAESIRRSQGVVATDNFIGHMAAYYGKPVLWINGSSDPAQVMPKGIQTRCVQVEPMPCRPCGHRCVNAHYKLCLSGLGVEEVWNVFERYLNTDLPDTGKSSSS